MSRSSDPQARATVINGWIVAAGSILAALITGFFALRATANLRSVEATSTSVAQTATQSSSNFEATNQAPVADPYPTQTPYPTYTPHPTYTPPPLPTEPQLPSATPTTSLSLPFQDSFDNKINPEWKILGGDILIQDGWLSATKDAVILGIGDDSITDFHLTFDYKNLRGVNEIFITFDQKIRLVIGQDGSGWQALEDNKWINISLFGGVGVSGQLTVNVTGNVYSAFLYQDPLQEITSGNPVGGPITITIVADRFIDNFFLSQP